MNKKGLTTLALGTSVLLGTASLCLPSKAANIQERAFSFYNMTESSTGTGKLSLGRDL